MPSYTTHSYTTHYDRLHVSKKNAPLPFRDVLPDEVLAKAVGARILRVMYEDDVNKEPTLYIVTDKGTLTMWHDRDCCESVYLDSGLDELDDLAGNIISLAQERSERAEGEESITWTFYEFQTADGGCATLRWCGTSNGYYSENVEVDWVEAT